MPIVPHRPRPGRLLDALVMAVLLFVFFGLAVYHYRRLDRTQVDPDKAKALAEQSFAESKATGNDWPQWRGPNRDGVSRETDLVTAWPAGGPKVLWQQPTGAGFASVSVVKGRVFTIFQDSKNEAVVAWDAETGAELWRFTYERSYTNPYGGGPRATPTIDGDFVYAVGGDGIMHCLKAFTDNPAGEVVWEKDLMKEFRAEVPKWGVAFSPLVENGRVFIQPGGPDGNSLAALDPRTGAILWKQHDDPASYSSPIGATIHGDRHILFFTGSRLVAVDPDTGQERWDYPWATDYGCNIATPIVVNDYVFISAYYGRGCAMLKIDKTGDQWQAGLVYKNKRMKNHFSTCVRSKDHLYGFNDSILTCMNLRTGKVAWEADDSTLFDKGSVLLVNDHLIIYGANGRLALAEANPEKYVEKSRFQFSARTHSCWSVPVVSNGRLYVRDQEKLACFDVKAASR